MNSQPEAGCEATAAEAVPPLTSGRLPCSMDAPKSGPAA